MSAHDPAHESTAFREVTRLFLRRLLDNDLVSPHADRHESLAVVYAFVASLGVFATFFISTNYLAAFIQLPGPAALTALSDRFLFIAASTAFSALAALAVWEALALEARDTAILGPLPIAARTITRAKLAAAMVFGTALTVVLNAVPSVLYPAFLTLNIRGISGGTILRLIAAHAITVTAAGLFGFFGILALRGTCRLLFGEQLFRRLSSSLQSALVVSVVTALLIAPTVRATDVRRWAGGISPVPVPAHPVMWYLGMNETLAGHLVNETPIVAPPRYSLAAIPTQGDQRARALYRALLPQFATLARRAWLSLVAAITIALTAFLWTNRRLPDRAVSVPGPARIRTGLRRIVERWTQDDPEAQAGFFFTYQTLSRSGPHRTILAIALAIGLTHALLVLAQRGLSDAAQATPLGVLRISSVLVLTLLAGAAYAMRMPAESGANWTIRMAWLGDERGYLAGVKRGVLLLPIAALILLLPLHVGLMGAPAAISHFALDALFAAAAANGLFLCTTTLPFACSYVPIENPKVVWPAGFAGLVLVTSLIAAVERWALQSVMRTLPLAAGMAALALLLHALDRAQRIERRPIRFNPRPTGTTQRLGLSAHFTFDD
jgi:hypothetical protein